MARHLTEAELLALPATMDVPTAGMAYGWGKTKSNLLARTGEFPVQVLTRGRSRLVTKYALLTDLGYLWDAVNGWRHPSAAGAKPDAA